jgi:predicted GTPase
MNDVEIQREDAPAVAVTGIATVREDAEEGPIERYHRLRRALIEECETVRTFIFEGSPGNALLEDLRRIREDLEGDVFKVGFFGVTAAGKSTLINSLVRDSLLREGLGETSRTLTRICPPTPKAPHGEVHVVFKSAERLHRELQGRLLSLGMDLDDGPAVNLGDPEFRSAIRDKLNSAEGETRDEASYRFVKHVMKGWDVCESRLGRRLVMSASEAEELVHHEDTASFVEERIIYHDNVITRRNIVLYDSPGLGSTFARHTEEAVRLARTADVAVVVTKVDYMFMPPDREFIENALDVQRTREIVNLVFVLNQINRINPMNHVPPRKPDEFDECVQDEIRRLGERIRELGFETPPILPVDAATGRWAREYALRPDDQACAFQRRLYSFAHTGGNASDDLKASRLEDLEEALLTRLTDMRYLLFLKGKLGKLRNSNNRYREECEDIHKKLDETVKELENELQRHEKARKEISRRLEEFFQGVLPLRLGHVYGDLDERINALADDVIGRLASGYAKRSVRDRAFRAESRRLWKEVMADHEANIMRELKVLRDSYERKYNDLKVEALERDIPDIVRSYDVGLPWRLRKDDIAKIAAERIFQGVQGIKLEWYQFALSWIKDWLRIEDFEKSVAAKLRENLYEKFAESFRHDVRSWVTRDMEYFGAQVMEYFVRLSESVEGRIKTTIGVMQSKAEEREAVKLRLESFISQCVAAENRLRELDRRIELADRHWSSKC